MKKYLLPAYVLFVVVVSGFVTFPAASLRDFIYLWIIEVVFLISLYFIISNFTAESKLKKIAKTFLVIIIAVLVLLTAGFVELGKFNTLNDGYKGEVYNRLSGEKEFYESNINLPWYKTFVCSDATTPLPVFMKDCIILQ